jgi:hypothetical protein
MIQRRGFLAGCLGLLASPLTMFSIRRPLPDPPVTINGIPIVWLPSFDQERKIVDLFGGELLAAGDQIALGCLRYSRWALAVTASLMPLQYSILRLHFKLRPGHNLPSLSCLAGSSRTVYLDLFETATSQKEVFNRVYRRLILAS